MHPFFACKLGIGVCAIRLKPLAFARYMDVFSFEIARDNTINSCINEIKCGSSDISSDTLQISQ